MNKIDKITQIVGQKFRSFGGGQENPFNPLSVALKDQPFQFAAGVDIKSVVEIVLSEAESGTPAEDRYGHEPDKVKPLTKYLTKYLRHEIVDVDLELLEQALDAYESTEQVKIRIEPA